MDKLSLVTPQVLVTVVHEKICANCFVLYDFVFYLEGSGLKFGLRNSISFGWDVSDGIHIKIKFKSQG